MDIRKIKKLIEMLQESDLNEIEVSQGEESVRISRGNNNTVSTQIPLSNNPIQVSEIGEDEIQQELSGNQIKSPIVGTFYRRPNPEKAAFINVGDVIEVGDVVCIVEAMKMMNEIKSEYSGKVVSIIAEDGQPVEFDQTLIIIE
ncbi:MAG: acetyl-CoA carboxylase biotin carboxyl carrier protein [SAR86 cluster bacterium]|jgi:acetyl-CoA carboxylase biotin carboxyl carrier protein|uniref:Biotin carboxyl carrier protein of acetyl-CoA carboxylase n=1 Tax=SAR86 cluster bacterium TaxID=2030880 RepID=A0A937M2P7_9GAMM|nr:acetyl-CoA carboxylase biotin carboxyl carrier protein [SAR86 cluster bacterium]MDG1721518.1 acetyl-CoA carboxylase biotin carboxyl carrier protein [SAR86 cluster bacterium]|tara:strand:- start:663 stop:1094 length:432 start_codon:yes stop_codon:yes gene_type:complete